MTKSPKVVLNLYLYSPSLWFRPTQRGSWSGLALSYHLLEDYETALWLLAQYRQSQAGVAKWQKQRPHNSKK
jgi:hypothetical protein